LYATATHISQRQPPTPIFERVKSFMWSAHVDDENVAEVWESAKNCRETQPGFLEIDTYRYREHVGPNFDWDLGYRSKEEVSEHMARDPLPVVRNKIDPKEATAIEEVNKRRVTAAFDNADAAPWPNEILR